MRQAIAYFILIFMIYLSYRLFNYFLFKPLGRKEGQRLKQSQVEYEEKELEEKILRWRLLYYNKFLSFIKLSDAKRAELDYLISRLDLTFMNRSKRPEEIVLEQYFIAACTFGIGLIWLAIIKPIGMGLIALTPMSYMALPWYYKTTLKDRDKVIQEEFVIFFKRIYPRIIRDHKVYLKSLVEDYYEMFSPWFQYELRIFASNLAEGEEKALELFARRLPYLYIVKWCDIMKIRVKGLDESSIAITANQLVNLNQKIEDDVETKLEKKLDKYIAVGKTLSVVIYLILTYFVIIYFKSQLADVVKLYNIK